MDGVQYENALLPTPPQVRPEITLELGVGNVRIQQLLDAAGIARRRPGGAGRARGLRAWQVGPQA